MTLIALVLSLACALAPVTLAQGEPTTHAPSVSPKWYVENLTWPEVRDAVAAGRASAIIYTGSTEQNGPHMALGKHNFIAHYVAGASPKR